MGDFYGFFDWVRCVRGGLFGAGEESGSVHILKYMVIQQTSKFCDIFAGLYVVLQIRVFQLLHSLQDIIALFAQVIHVWVVIGEFGGWAHFGCCFGVKW